VLLVEFRLRGQERVGPGAGPLASHTKGMDSYCGFSVISKPHPNKPCARVVTYFSNPRKWALNRAASPFDVFLCLCNHPVGPFGPRVGGPKDGILLGRGLQVGGRLIGGVNVGYISTRETAIKHLNKCPEISIFRPNQRSTFRIFRVFQNTCFSMCSMCGEYKGLFKLNLNIFNASPPWLIRPFSKFDTIFWVPVTIFLNLKYFVCSSE